MVGVRTAFGPWPSAEPSVLSPGARPRAGGADTRSRGPVSTRPRARPSSGTSLIGLVAVVVVVLVAIWVVLNGQAIARSFFPPDPATTQGVAIHNLYTIVFIIAVAIFFVVEGLIVWTVIPYPPKPRDDDLPPP